MAKKGGSWQGEMKPNLLKRPPETRPKDSSLGGTFKDGPKRPGQ